MDAPAVAVAWQLLFALSFRVRVPWPATLLLAVSTWLIYLADRLLDARQPRFHTARHIFYRDHARLLAPVLLTGTFAAAAWLLPLLDRSVFRAGLLMSLGMLLYFTLIHFAPARLACMLPKELAVAVLFTLGTSLPVYAEAPARAFALSVPLLLFAALAWFNALAIDRWEAEHPVSWLPHAALSASLFAIACATLSPRHPFLYAALAVSGLCFAILAAVRSRFSLNALRVLADAVLAFPAVLAALAFHLR